MLLARSMDKLEEVRDEIQNETGIHPLIYQLDVSDPDAIKTVFDAIFDEVKEIDILVNNAGFAIFDYFREADINDFKNMLDVNVFGLMACTRIVLPKMLQRRAQGQIINIASLAGKVPTPKSTVYAATKHAVLGFTNGLRMELAGTNVRVTAVNPGPINTNFFTLADPSGDYVKNVRAFILKPDVVAKKVVRSMEKPRREVNMPFAMSAGSRMYQAVPELFEKVVGKIFDRK
ncbi:hypothetical protein KBTX_04406 [wastewater metagenome]|uniref:Short chain dehydrogenase n=2 Tax=unclassified sequences TaxID=12908 RepID=A0A5B8RJ42_9ZZZZ|nr:hypothetical protein KBTEX_04406 [uncultured organism]